MKKWMILWGVSFGMTAVILGAFAAHALKEVLSSDQLSSFQTGVRYQMYHALLLIIIGWQDKIDLSLVGKLMIIGVLLFSLSIYTLNIRELIDVTDLSLLGPITPIGGLFLISAWLILLLKIMQYKK